MLADFVKKPRLRTAKLESLKAPVGGWNARDAISDMDPEDAVILDNWFPTPADLMIRQGYSDHVTSVLGGDVESLMAYHSPSGTQRLYAAAGTAIYNVTAASATSSIAVSGLANARFQHINFTNSSGSSFLLCVNGSNGVRSFDGTTWGTQAITGATASAFAHITQHKRRVWFCLDASLRAFYLNTDSVSGTAAFIDLSGFARKGGELNAIDTWTLDAGEGIDDYWVACTDQGELIVYKGTDPTSDATWTMVGRWELGRPLGRRCFIKYAGDLLYLAEDGVWPLSKAVISGQIQPRVAVTDKIVNAMSTAAGLYFTNFGWQMVFHPKVPFVLVNIPVGAGLQEQYVMNTITGAWCRFTGVDAICWEWFAGDLYFGGANFVSKFWSTFEDDGISVTAVVKQAFHYFKTKTLKKFEMVRPLLQSNTGPNSTVSIGINTDFDDTEITSIVTFGALSGSLWDTALWDGDTWGGALGVLKRWYTVSGIGFAAATRMRIQNPGAEVRWQATDFLYNPGAVIG